MYAQSEKNLCDHITNMGLASGVVWKVAKPLKGYLNG